MNMEDGQKKLSNINLDAPGFLGIFNFAHPSVSGHIFGVEMIATQFAFGIFGHTVDAHFTGMFCRDLQRQFHRNELFCFASDNDSTFLLFRRNSFDLVYRDEAVQGRVLDGQVDDQVKVFNRARHLAFAVEMLEALAF